MRDELRPAEGEFVDELRGSLHRVFVKNVGSVGCRYADESNEFGIEDGLFLECQQVRLKHDVPVSLTIRNPEILCRQVDYTNLPHIIMQNPRAVSINNTTQMDLQGQAASETAGHRQISGTGGQLQFVRGAYAAPEGKSFMCLSSTYTGRGMPESRIVVELTPGNVVTTPRTDIMYVATEYGMVNLKGMSVAERALALISIAHPQFRESLDRAAREKGLIPRWFH